VLRLFRVPSGTLSLARSHLALLKILHTAESPRNPAQTPEGSVGAKS